MIDFKDERIKQLEEALAHANQRIRILMDMTEDVCCGTRLDCPKCKQLMPCMCAHEKPLDNPKTVAYHTLVLL
jgi:hypothetical protein